MTAALVQSASNTTSGVALTTITVTLTNPTGSGNCLVVKVSEFNAGTTNPIVTGITLGGSAGNFAVAKSVVDNNTINTDIWTDQSAASGQTSVVITFNPGTAGNTTTYFAWVEEWSGVLLTSAVDKTNGTTTTTASWSSGSTGVLSQANEVITAVACELGSISAPVMLPPGAPWTNQTALSTGVLSSISGYQVVSATTAQTYSGTASGGGTSGAAVITLKAAAAPVSSPTTIPVLNTKTPYPLNLIAPNLRPQVPNQPVFYVPGITAQVFVQGVIGAPQVSKQQTPNENVAAKTGGIHIQQVFNPPVPYPLTAPYPLNITLGTHKLTVQSVAVTPSPPTIYFGIPAVSNAIATPVTTTITTPGVYNWQFPFANNLPYPLNIINRNVKPSIQGQPGFFVKQPGGSNVSAVAPFGTITIKETVPTANVNAASNFTGIFIQGKVQPTFPYLNYPNYLKLRTIHPQYSSGKILYPTQIFIPRANVTATAILGAPGIGRAVPGFVSNVFAATVPGTVVEIEHPPVSNDAIAPRLGTIKVFFSGITAHASVAANTGITKVSVPGITARTNVNPEFGIVRSGSTVAGIVSHVNAVANIGNPTVSMHLTANVSSATTAGIKVSKPGNVSTASVQARFGNIVISTANTARVTIASSVHLKVSPSITNAKVSQKSSASTRVSSSQSPSSVTAASIPGERTAIGEISFVSASAPKGTVKISVSGISSSVTAKANNQGKVVPGITAHVTSSSTIGAVSTAFNITAKVSAKSYLGPAGVNKVIANVVRNTWSARVEGD